MRRIAILALAMLLLVALAVPAGAVGDSLPWTKYCQTNQTVKSHGYGYNWQTHTRGSTSWWEATTRGSNRDLTPGGDMPGEVAMSTVTRP